jgi:hypothetical protein
MRRRGLARFELRATVFWTTVDGNFFNCSKYIYFRVNALIKAETVQQTSIQFNATALSCFFLTTYLMSWQVCFLVTSFKSIDLTVDVLNFNRRIVKFWLFGNETKNLDGKST